MSISKKLIAISGGATAYDLANARYTPPEGLEWDITNSVQTTSIQTTDGIDVDISGLNYSSDGYKLYTVSLQSDAIDEFDLSTAFDVSTLSLSSTFDVSGFCTRPEGLTFSPDGYHAYLCDNTGVVDQIDLSTAWDLSTASYNQSFNHGDAIVYSGIAFKPDGLKMFLLNQDDEVVTYTLSTAWDVSTAGSASTTSITKASYIPEDIGFKDDGTVMYVISSGSPNEIVQYTLSTAWDVSTATLDTTLTLSADAPHGLAMMPNGAGFIVSDHTNDTITHVIFGDAGFHASSASSSFYMREDGERAYFTEDSSTDRISRYDFSTAWDFSTASEVTPRELIVNCQGIFFKPDGTKMYVADTTADQVEEYSLSTAWDITTATSTHDLSVSGQDTGPQGIFFKPDGTKFFMCGGANDSVYEYALSTAWDLSSASYTQSFDVSNETPNPDNLYMTDNGSLMFIVDTNEKLYKYTLGTPWDVSTASFEQQMSLRMVDGVTIGIYFRSGTEFITFGRNGKTFRTYIIGDY